jgi:hypothetical protein
MALPASKPLDLYRGDTFPFAARLWADAAMTVPVDLSSVVPRAQLRTLYALPELVDSLILEIACVVELPNIVHMVINAADWPATVCDDARWDLQLTDAGGTVRTVLAGPVRITGDVTVP